MAAEYRLQIRVRNNLLLRRLEATPGYVNVRRFCAKHGFHYAQVVELIGMKSRPVTAKGEWREIVERLASILKASPVDLFPERQVRGEVLATTVEREVGEDELIGLSEPAAQALIDERTPERLFEDADLVAKLLAVLPANERVLVSRHFGLAGEPRRTFDDLSQELGVSTARVAQLIYKALAQMRGAAYRRHHLISAEQYHGIGGPR